LLLPLLLFVATGGLEGSPTRLWVRSPSFVLGSVLLSFFGAHFATTVVTSRRALHWPMIVIQAVVIPCGWLYSIQHYYHGGKNQDYASLSLFFGLLMMINGVLYLCSLFARRKLHAPPCASASPLNYTVALYRLNGDKPATTAVYQHSSADPQQVICLDGFSRTLTIDLEDYWNMMTVARNTDFSTPATTYETIVKFGQTQQIVDHYQLDLYIDYDQK